MIFRKKPVPDSIDFLKPTAKSLTYLTKPKKRAKYKKFLLYFFVFVTIAGMGFSSRIIISSSEAINNLGGGGILSQLKNLLIKKQTNIAGAREDRINILLLGIGGNQHPGPYLTDSIILVSLQPSKGQAAMLSIPRDLYVESAKLGGNKINAMYALGQAQGERKGGQLIKQIIGETFGINIHYYARIDFDGFIELIDALGGIDIYVDKTFVDKQFPTPGFKTKIVSFKAGWQRFDGTKALQYARSRHGNAGEGSDFARAKRQQKILLAVKQKILKLGLLLRPDRINTIIQILGNSVETDLEIWELVKLAQIFNNVKTDEIVQKVLDDSPQGELRAITGIDGSFLLIPKDKQKLQEIAQNIFVINDLKQEQASVILQNGTDVPGLASSTKNFLENNGFVILKTKNAGKQSYVKTVIFDLTRGTKPKSLDYLKNQLNGNVSNYIPAELWKENSDADFVVILGKS
jgi:LCP family protein required for cell wall assembly